MAVQRNMISVLIATGLVGGCAATGSSPTQADADQSVFFDDFTYAGTDAMRANGWVIRDKAGLPGITGGKWGGDAVSLVDDPLQPGNRAARMTARTDGTAANTVQAQLCHARKYLEGTYAARVRFSDQPTLGPDGDALVQSFYAITPLKQPLDPQYSELDWEYLPNGGWGDPKTRLYSTSWQTVQLDPWSAHNQHSEDHRSYAGWHTLVMQVSDGKIRHFVDGKPFSVHGGRNYPVAPMAISFNLWFINGGTLANDNNPREYQEDIDWVFHAKNRVLSPEQIDAAVRKMRGAAKTHLDTVPAANPPLTSSCDF